MRTGLRQLLDCATMSNANSLAFRPSGSIDFDPTPITPAAAPAAPVDDKIDHDPLSINFGREKVYKAAATERMLAGATIDWLIAFALDARPKALCEKYPHVANRLAQGWTHVARSMVAVKQLAEWNDAASLERIAKQLTAAGFQLKGSGWYATDFKGGGTTAKPADAKSDTTVAPASSSPSSGGPAGAAAIRVDLRHLAGQRPRRPGRSPAHR